MRNRHQWHWLALAIGISPAPAAAEPAVAPPLRIDVHIVADLGVPASVVAKAKPQTSRIYQLIDVELVWRDAPSPDGITIRVVEKARREAGAGAMGIAPRSAAGIGRELYAFYGRIEAFAWRHGRPVSNVLGHVMAHELGHLLLPYGSHTKHGLMVAAWDRTQIEEIGRGGLSMTSEQGAAIRARVKELLAAR